jgi:hypothetical protein
MNGLWELGLDTVFCGKVKRITEDAEQEERSQRELWWGTAVQAAEKRHLAGHFKKARG